MADRSLRCTVQNRALGASPAGTASSARAFVLVETPLPWPSDVADHPLLAPLAPVLKAHGARLQALVPADPAGASAGQVRLVVHRQPKADLVQPYARAERAVAADGLVDAVSDLLAAPPGRTANATGPADDVRDVLVCTHGSRDVCCGSEGVAVHQALQAMDLPGVRVWRTSHTGGHRFAPTAVTFPDGRAWAWADVELLAGILTRSADPAVAGRHDRGSTAMRDPFAQAADTAVLAEEGWAWLDQPRSVEVTTVNSGDRRLVTLAAPGVTYRAEALAKRMVPVPDCGRPLDEARKSSPEVEVVRLERL